MPVLDGLTSLILTIIETAKGYFGVKVAKYNSQMRAAATPEENPVGPIGFSYEFENEEEEENEY